MSGDLSWTTWYGQNRKRWPMTLGIWLGMAFTTYSILVGYGYRLAQERLPITRAAVIARNQPPVPEDRNAAVLYDQATKVLIPWKKMDKQPSASSFEEQEQRKSSDPDQLRRENWRHEETFAADGPLRTFTRTNAEATRLTLEGTARSDIDWGIPAEDFPKASITRLSNLRPLIRLVSQQALVAAQDGDWPTFIMHLQAMERAADHARRGVGVMPFLIGTSLAAQTWTTATHSLALPGSTPADEQTLRALRSLSLEGTRSHLADLHRAMIDERLTCGHVIDQVGCGDFSGLSERSGNDGMGVLPQPVSVYSAFYPWDRSAFDDLMEGHQEALLAAIENRSPVRPAADPEKVFFTDPRLVYAHLFKLSVTGMVTPVISILSPMERERQNKWRMFTASIDLSLWMLRTKQVPATFDEAGVDPVLLQDPFLKDQRLQLRRDDDGMLRLWSVGKNRKDDTTTPPVGLYAHSDDVTIFIRVRMP